ncbi:YdeI/OmpD-associated family protein [Pseudonocardia sp. DSM 110487]|uniref:YdeI/OmpD-associated family protein n=1 Tax=Pseudonocardia sp. DSM 110487 TaxID=2865833 RepID=UPI001C6A71AD|nr:YdeI/OmpD-associated family protein [Pseudonocardia sp. DSM 110487]QYN39340.1 YdeI/OmpD-associated family protein [Pseudonocardia sp. DSM 110487]
MTRDQRGPVSDRSQRFAATVAVDRQGRTHVPVPFEPDAVWGAKPRHHVTGTVGGRGVRGALDAGDGGVVLILGPAWSRGCDPADGTRVDVVLTPEGPQRGDLAPDVAAALDASPAAGVFFDSLAQFYRKAFLRWIDATRRRPEQRPVRIAEMVRLLEEGKKER